MNTNTRTHSTVRNERTLGDLFSDLSQEAGLLVRQELQLAKVEMQQKATEASREVAFITVGAVVANAALLSLVVALILGLANFIDAWLSALIVGIVLAIVAGLLATKGIQALREMNVVPIRTLTTLEEDKEWLQRQVS
jgi:uncharacterized membrane protein YqjE